MSAAAPSAIAESTAPSDSGLPRERRPRGPRRWMLVGVVVVLVVAGALVGLTNPFGGAGPAPGGVADNAYPTALDTVERRSLTSQVQVPATLVYAGSYSAINQAQGTITTLPSVGQIVRQGQPLYGVNGSPVVLLYGPTPAHRSLAEGMSGADVAELNADLVALGLATRAQLDPTSDYFGAATAAALDNLQADLGITRTGSLPLGQAVFLPSAARITAVQATLGTAAQAGATVLKASSTTRKVTVKLDATEQASVKVGDQVTITLPNNQTTPGIVSSVGTVATSGSSGSTIDVDIALSDPAATGSLDQAPVEVSITTASVEDALVVPVTALLALSGGGYAVETVDARGVHHLVPVTLGLFDDADGLVQVSGAGLSAGQSIVVPAT